MQIAPLALESDGPGKLAMQPGAHNFQIIAPHLQGVLNHASYS